MKITENLHLSINRKGTVWIKNENEKTWTEITDPKQCALYSKIKDIASKRTMLQNVKEKKILDLLTTINNSVINTLNFNDNEELVNAKQLTLQNTMNFFTEFNFEVNFRFINTLSRYSTSYEEATNYVVNYFKLTNTIDVSSIIEKMKSIEWSNIISQLASYNTKKQINKRFKVYYGSQGTGKTTSALKETDNICMVCHSAMLPSDLMEDFKFIDGKATFQPSALQIAMVNGTAITLDEINLLPFESLRFLQSILDDKQQIEWKGQTVRIKDGFKIIGTMNLVVNGSTFNLPEPLVDRCSEIKEYKLTANNLLGAI